MNRQLADDTIDEKMQKVREHIHALKGVVNGIPLNSKEPTMVDLLQLHALLSIVVDSMDGSLEQACHELAEYFKTWGD